MAKRQGTGGVRERQSQRDVLPEGAAPTERNLWLEISELQEKLDDAEARGKLIEASRLREEIRTMTLRADEERRSTDPEADDEYRNKGFSAVEHPSQGRLMAVLHAGSIDQATTTHLARVYQGWPVPALKHLALLQRLLRVADAMLDCPDADASWTHLARVDAVLAERLPQRAAAVRIIASLRAELAGYEARASRKGERQGRRAAFAAERQAAAMERAMGVLAALDPAFARVQIAEFTRLVTDGTRGPPGVAAKLSLLTGAFADEKRKRESDAAAYTRVKKLYESAIKAARKVPTL